MAELAQFGRTLAHDAGANVAGGTAIVCEPSAVGDARLQGWLAQRGLVDSHCFAPRDVNDLERAIDAGRIATIIFPTAADFLSLLWSEEIDLACWRRAGLRIEFASERGPADHAWAAEILGRWEAHLTRLRRRRTIAGLILSAIAIAAAAGVLMLAR